jgi:hypothetical protein
VASGQGRSGSGGPARKRVDAPSSMSELPLSHSTARRCARISRKAYQVGSRYGYTSCNSSLNRRKAPLPRIARASRRPARSFRPRPARRCRCQRSRTRSRRFAGRSATGARSRPGRPARSRSPPGPASPDQAPGQDNPVLQKPSEERDRGRSGRCLGRIRRCSPRGGGSPHRSRIEKHQRPWLA